MLLQPLLLLLLLMLKSYYNRLDCLSQLLELHPALLRQVGVSMFMPATAPDKHPTLPYQLHYITPVCDRDIQQDFNGLLLRAVSERTSRAPVCQRQPFVRC
jgi:hypothetical protein